MSLNATLVITGDEVLRGFVRDAHIQFVARELRSVGASLTGVRLVGDDAHELSQALRAACDESIGMLIVTGGLGPTHDDRTSEAVAGLLGRELQLFDDALAVVEERVRSYGRLRTEHDHEVFGPGNRKQATLPAGATWLQPGGTAPGYVVGGDDDTGGPVCVVLPGPPSEMRHAWQQIFEVPSVAQRCAQIERVAERVVRIWGAAESQAAHLLGEVGHEDSERVRVTLCARDSELEMSIRGSDAAAVASLTDAIHDHFGSQVFALDDERSVGEIVGDLLVRKNATVAVAESCTGGMLGSVLTATPGSSAYFLGGVISYANSVKCGVLGVDPQLIATHGAVSEAVAQAMATGVRTVCGSEYGISITGLAGPDGGSPAKPVGTVWIGIAGPETVQAVCRPTRGDRDTIRTRSATAALHLLRETLQ